MTKTNLPTFVGIDVAKAKLDVFIDQPGNPCAMTVANDPKGIASITKRLRGLEIEIIVIEHSGRYERQCAIDLMDEGFPVAMINPRQSRDFARAISWLAKNDAIDAKLLAEFGKCVELRITERPREKQMKLDELVGRRRQIVQIRAMEKTRLQQVGNKDVTRSIEAMIKMTDEQINDLEQRIAAMIEDDDDWRGKAKRLETVPGVGKAVARTLISDLPELGNISREEVASLVGVAPFDRESGNWKGRRSCFGGRAQVRSMLYMAVITAKRCNPLINAYAQRLTAAGKPFKVVMVACMRKLLTVLNTMVAKEQDWNPKWSEQP